MEKTPLISAKIGSVDIIPNEGIPSNVIVVHSGEIMHIYIDGRHAYELTYEDFINLATRKAVINTKP